jgi:rhamnosyltransferase
MKKRICAVTVLYNPSGDFIRALESYYGQVQRVFIIDNSETPESSGGIREILKTGYRRCRYYSCSGNQGIARALNEGMKSAIEEGFSYALLMDQDSLFPSGGVERLVSVFNENDKVFIAAPVIAYSDQQYRILSAGDNGGIRDRLTAITSGSLVDLSLAGKIGFHDERLFIDLVDHEYCLRARSLGCRILVVNGVVLRQFLGEMENRRIGPLKFHPTNHSASRRYYKARNSLFLWKRYLFRYPRYVLPGILGFIRLYINIILFEKEKLEKTLMIGRGFRDAMLSSMALSRFSVKASQENIKKNQIEDHHHFPQRF